MQRSGTSKNHRHTKRSVFVPPIGDGSCFDVFQMEGLVGEVCLRLKIVGPTLVLIIPGHDGMTGGKRPDRSPMLGKTQDWSICSSLCTSLSPSLLPSRSPGQRSRRKEKDKCSPPHKRSGKPVLPVLFPASCVGPLSFLPSLRHV